MSERTRVEYSTNNSGGRWWLKDEDWKALERAGWDVAWGGTYFCHSQLSFGKRPPGKPEPCPKPRMKDGREWNDCPGHRRYDTAEAVGEDRYMDALAKDAYFNGSLEDAIRSWEKATGKDASAVGCNCCGPLHSFSSNEGYASGDSILPLLYGDGPKTLREAYEAAKGAKR